MISIRGNADARGLGCHLGAMLVCEGLATMGIRSIQVTCRVIGDQIQAATVGCDWVCGPEAARVWAEVCSSYCYRGS